ncbi:glutathione S-transferase family protein [Plectonema cf. radiosum LEGE 06105]|uniref:Glutathione S-transferase family protein n=1 Tax=Plectonema cf. radiosum LEGE 06105 TaxID=945769 RepID=A0A8J7K2B5_9CYAN|nr:glutathione S-transferase family protein [Plectonema radiosum]MBE9213922.1 glutathione S-transferase family protein [Plectonema cf. radiosum LEGE 06105]
MKLYYAPASSYSQRVLIALYEKQIDFTPVEVNLFDVESRTQYLQINRFGKIPTLITDDGEVLLEANIIIEYLDGSDGNIPLIPQDMKLALEMRMLERIVDVYINGGREALFKDSQRPLEERGNKEVIKAKGLLEEACNLLNEKLANRTWLVGKDFTLADCAAAPTLSYLRIVYNYEHLENLTAYFKRLEEKASVARVFHEGREQMMQMLSTLKYPVNTHL